MSPNLAYIPPFSTPTDRHTVEQWVQQLAAVGRSSNVPSAWWPLAWNDVKILLLDKVTRFDLRTE